MSVAAVLYPVADLIVRVAEETPKDEDVKAGWTAFVIFLLLIGAVVVLGFSLVKQLRKAQAAEDAGLYDPSDKKQPVELPVDQPSEQPPTPGA
jgi:hypothetical protein